MSTAQTIAIIVTLYLLVMLAIIISIITRKYNWLGIEDDEFIPVLLWPITVFWWFVTKIHNFVHR